MKLLRHPGCLRILFSCLVFAPGILISQTKNYPSLLWEISGNGVSKPSYLYGTMHVSKKVAFHLTDAFFDGLKSTEVVALETNPETWLSEIMSEGMSMVSSRYYRNFFGNSNSGFYKGAFNFTVPGNKFIQTQISKEPEDVNGLLYRYNGYSGNFEEYTYLDLFIFQSAKKSGKQVIALEDFRTSMEMLTKASMPDDEKDAAQGRKTYPPYDIGDRIEDAYRRGDLDALDSLDRLVYQSKNFQKYMLTDRNVIMADNMDSIMRKQTLFTAIGAAHLPGEDGVINLLRKMGYTVKPVMSSVSKKSIKAMNGYEEAHTPLNFQTQFAVDSSFKVDAPGKLFEMSGFDQMDAYLYTDMVNGSYYMVKRIRNYGLLAGQDAAYQSRRIDSMLYESIPGKIIRKETIKANNGDPGFDITNKTRRGDIQRYRIYTSDKYITIFKVSGIGDYVKNSDADKFFRSVTFRTESAKPSFTAYSPASGGYSVSLPANMEIVKPKGAEYQKERITASEGQNFYIFARSVLTDHFYIEEDTFELSQLAKGFYESMDFEPASKEFGTHASLPCINVTAKKKDLDSYLHFRIVLKDQQYFLLACKSAGKQVPSDYFSSLRFTELKHEGMSTYTDTALYYSVTTDYKEKKKTLVESLTSSMGGYYGKSKEPAPYLGWQEYKLIESPATGEVVELNVMKCSDLRMEKSTDEFWKSQTDYYTGSSMIVNKSSKFEKDGAQGMDIIVSDTNSVKRIRTRLLMKGGLLYILNSTFDTISGPGEWANTFYDSFKPADTLIGRTMFEDKVAEFLKDAGSKDSISRDKVESLSHELAFEDKHAAPLMKFIAGADFNNASQNLKSTLFRKLGSLKDPAIPGFLKAQYPKYTDSASIQLTILYAMASQKTEEGSRVFLQSVTTDSPLSSAEFGVQEIFSPFYDSLRLARNLFPQLLSLTKYPEYKSGIYNLLGNLLDSSLVSPQVYAAFKKDLLREANDELKRQIASEENNSKDSYNPSYTGNYGGSKDDEMARLIAEAEAAAMQAAMMAEQDASNAATGYNSNWLLQDYCKLLGPFYAEPAVRSLFDKALKTKAEDLRIALISTLLKNNQPVADSTIDQLSKDLKTRAGIYASLKSLKKLERMKPEYRTQSSLSEAMLFSNKKNVPDSISLVETRYVESKTRKGNVLFFRSTDKDNKFSTLHFVAFQPKDTSAFEIDYRYTSSRVLDEKDDINKVMDEICYELTLTGRKRAKEVYWNNLYSDFSYGEE